MVGSNPEQEPAPARGSVWRRHPRRSAFSALALVLVVGFVVWWFAVRDDGSSAAVTTTTTKQLVTVTRGPLTDSIAAEGTVAAAQTDELSFGAAGTVTAVNVAAGQKVTAGQVLATLDSSSLQSAVDQAQSDLADAQATLADDQSSGASSTQLTVDQTRVQSAQDSLTSAQTKLAGATLTATFDGTVTTVNVSVGEQLGTSGAGGTDQTGSSSGSGNSSSTLGSNSSNAANTPNGSNGGSGNSSSSSADIEVVSAGHYTSQLMVDSSQVDSVKAGSPVTVTVSTGSSNGGFGNFGGFGRFGANRAALGGAGTNGTGTNATGTNGTGTNGTGTKGTGSTGTGATGTGAGSTATGTVTVVGQVADASSGVAQYPVTITFDSDDAAFSVGTSITGAISSTVKDGVIQVPVRAVSTQDGTSTVTVALDGKADGRTKTVPVTTGESAGGEIEITKGLDEGQQVVVENVVITGGDTGGIGGTGSTGGTRQFPGGGEFPGGGQFPGGGRFGGAGQ